MAFSLTSGTLYGCGGADGSMVGKGIKSSWTPPACGLGFMDVNWAGVVCGACVEGEE